MNEMNRPIYDDGTYLVTDAIIATPRKFYPITNTTAHIRRDPLWTGLGVCVLGVLSIAVYGDLLLASEKIILIVLCAIAALMGSQMSILRIDAVGHRPAMIVGRHRRLVLLYRALRNTHSIETENVSHKSNCYRTIDEDNRPI
jgi:hypothetical protein